MSIPGTVSVELSIPGDELKTHYIEDEPSPSHREEMDYLKEEIKLQIEVETENEKTCINPNKPTDKSSLSTNHVAVAKLGDLHTFNSFLIQTNPNNGDNIHNSITPAHFLLSSPSSTNGTPVTSETQVSTNDRAHMQASVLCQYPLQTIGVPPSTIMYAKPEYKGTAIPFPTQSWSYPYVPCSSPVTPGSYIQPNPVSLPPTYQVVYGIPPNHIQTAGPQLYTPQVVIQSPNTSVDMNGSVKSQQQKEKKVHIKKPLNAFMLFMKEQRAKVIQECTLKESAAINQILGKMWHSLDKQEQAKYYDMARSERTTHMQLYPSWSARDNYATKSKRKRKRKEEEGFEGETKKCFLRNSAANQLPMWCTSCRKRKNSDCNSMEGGEIDCVGSAEYCCCKTQAYIISETFNKLLAKKEQFLSELCPNSPDTDQSKD
eukprot:TRINITY_DN281_c0_g1_i10.p1 TRINITY_DN281_c0_g1~~TRINITY_DN281_c0_g1_i10.p1  ORF type:complete len:430 (-),score=104.24 TRINITY_DN281_c0_g1_i10:116-1405(-)